MDEELIRLLGSYNKQTSINVIKNRNCGAPLLGLAKYILIFNGVSVARVFIYSVLVTRVFV